MEQNRAKNQKIMAIVGLLVIVVVIAVGVIATSGGKDDQAAKMMQQPATQPVSSSQSTTIQSNSYKDGTYTATGHYDSPGGREGVTLTATLERGTITNSDITYETTDPTADSFQTRFNSGYKQLVIGKNINDVRLSRVSGSSLTSQGFNAALERIKDQARS